MYDQASALNVDEDAFMREFKFYRQQVDERNLLTIEKLNDVQMKEYNLRPVDLKKCQVEKDLSERCKFYGLKSLSDWICYESTDLTGLYLIKNPFLPGYQRFFVKKCLVDYHNLPNKTNLDLHVKRDVNLWTKAMSSKSFAEFNKLRWTTIGYHYDWTKKVYDANDFNDVPVDVKNLTKFLARVVGFENFEPEAGIINYYHLNSTLSAHQDRSEENMNAPLISMSLGSSAIFLIGADTKSVKPKAICLKSGDILIMSSKSRYSYHAVPKIFPDKNLLAYFTYDTLENEEAKEFLKSEFYVSEQEWSPIYEYIKINRINLNIRQVY